MEKRRKFDVLLWPAAAVLVLSIQGCSVFSSSAKAPNDGNAFRAPTVSSTGTPVPLPVEIAEDIRTIASGGQVAPVNPQIPITIVAPQAAAPAVAGETRAPATAVVVTADAKVVEQPLQGCNCDADTESDAKAKPDAKKKFSRGKGPSRKYASSGGQRRKRSPEDYTVKDGDTLMKISFEKYGDVYRWREIYNANKSKIPDYNNLVEGTVLRIAGTEYIVVQRNGIPYLIKRNDTLVKISRNVYGTPKRWRSLWENNPLLIRDPNKIYAGFTLYYLPPNGVPTPVTELPPSTEPKLPAPGPLQQRTRLPATQN